MTVFDELEKFMNEHSSSTALRDHVAFLREQMAVLIRENAMLKNKICLCIAEAKVLETQVKNLESAKGDKEDSQSIVKIPAD